MPVDDAATGQVVGRQLDDDSVGRENTDVVLPHLAADRGQHAMAVDEFHPEHRVRQCFDDLALELEGTFLFRHCSPDLNVDAPETQVTDS